jgi:hypothetical protein
MGTINWQRVLLGGIVAGIVVFVIDFVSFGFLFNSIVNSAFEALGRSFEDGGPMQLVLFIGTSLLTGIAAVWLYAAIRPRFGAGARTATVAGLTVWLLVYVLPGLGLTSTLFPASLVIASIGVGLFESLVATHAGAYLYQE